MAQVDYIEVTATPFGGEPRTIRLPDSERGRELADYVKSLQRREELDVVDVRIPGAKPTKAAAKSTPADS